MSWPSCRIFTVTPSREVKQEHSSVWGCGSSWPSGWLTVEVCCCWIPSMGTFVVFCSNGRQTVAAFWQATFPRATLRTELWCQHDDRDRSELAEYFSVFLVCGDGDRGEDAKSVLKLRRALQMEKLRPRGVSWVSYFVACLKVHFSSKTLTLDIMHTTYIIWPHLAFNKEGWDI